MTSGRRARGDWLRRFAERTLDRETLDRVILPALADLQYECGGDAAASGPVRLRAYWGLWKALALCLVAQWARWGRPAAQGVAWRMLIILPIVAGVLMVPAIDAELRRPLVSTQLILLSLPQAVALALPIAFFFSVALERRPVSLRRLVPAIFLMSLVCSLLMAAALLSVVPRANHAYAVSVYEQLKAAGRPTAVSFGAGEWTFTELVAMAQSESSERDRARARHMLGMRLATAGAPIMLGFLALGIAGYERQHSLFNGLWLLMFYAAALRAVAGSSHTGPSIAGVWLVNAVFCLAGLWLVWLRPTPLKDEVKGYVIS
jgi:hypothetical protein